MAVRVTGLLDLLDRACAAAQAAGWRLTLFHGTMLGVHRDGRLLPDDHDLDLAVLADEWDDSHRGHLLRAGLVVMKERAWGWRGWQLDHVACEFHGRHSILRLNRKGVTTANPHIDFHILTPGAGPSEGFLLNQRFKNLLARTPAAPYAGLTATTVEGRNVWMPGDAGAVCDWYYGDWKEPVARDEWMRSTVRREAHRRTIVRP